MISPALAEGIITRHTDAIRRDAEALLTVISWADAPAGVAVLPMYHWQGLGGCSIGSGHSLAVASGRRPGSVAVLVDFAGIIRQAMPPGSAVDDAAVGLVVARMMAESVAVHELAHALVSTPDEAVSPGDAAAFIDAAKSAPLGTGAMSHHPRWAAAVVILTERMIALRPAEEREARQRISARDLRGYGFDAAVVADAVGSVAIEASLRELLADGGEVARGVAAACRPEPERQRVIEEFRQRGAAGGVTVSA